MARGRRQRMGIAALVAALGTVIVPMVEQQRVTAGGGRLAVVCLAMTAATAVAVLAALLGRELRVLTSNQGDRLVRGLHLSGLAASALEPIGHDPVHGFQAVYAAWRQVGHRLAEA